MGSLLRATFLVVALSIGAASFPADATLPAAVRNDTAYMSWLSSLTEQVSQDPHYRRIPLDSESRTEEFTAVLHEVFRGRMTDAEFTDWIADRYPGHGYETATILRILHVHWKLQGR